jgi:TolB-like protein
MKLPQIILVLLFNSALWPAKPTHISIGVNDLQTQATTAKYSSLGLGISQMLVSALNTVQHVLVIGRYDLKEALDEIALGQTGLLDEKTTVKVGEMVGANYLVNGAFHEVEGQIRLDVRLIDVATGATLISIRNAGSVQNYFSVIEKTEKELVEKLRLLTKLKLEIDKLHKPDIEALVDLSDGLKQKDEGNPIAAIGKINDAISKDPDFVAAKMQFIEAFLSLRKGNFWRYKKTEELHKGRIFTADVNFHTGARTTFNGQRCFSYITEKENRKAGKIVSTEVRTTYYFQGKDGIYSPGSESSIRGKLRDVQTRIVYKKPMLTYPYEVKTGDSWKYDTVYDYTYLSKEKGETKFTERPQFSQHNRHMRGETRVAGKEKIKVPKIGLVDSFILEKRGTGYKVSTSWFTPGIGVVRTKWTGGKNINSTSDLVDFRIH